MNKLQLHEKFTELLRVHHTQLFGYLYALVQDIDHAEDLYQQTCLVLWKKFHQYEDGTSFFSWARTTARYEVMNFIRKTQRRRAHFSEEFQVELAAVYEEIDTDTMDARREALRGCMEKLDEDDRRLVEMCYADNRTFKQVAEQLDRPAKSVYDALGRIRRSLLKCITLALAKEKW